MSIKRQPIKIGVAAKMLAVSVTAIKRRLAGTESLALFKRKGCADNYVWLSEVEKLLADENLIIIAKGQPKRKK